MYSDTDSESSDLIQFKESMSAKEISAWLIVNGIPERFAAVFEGN